MISPSSHKVVTCLEAVGMGDFIAAAIYQMIVSCYHSITTYY